MLTREELTALFNALNTPEGEEETRDTPDLWYKMLDLFAGQPCDFFDGGVVPTAETARAQEAATEAEAERRRRDDEARRWQARVDNPIPVSLLIATVAQGMEPPMGWMPQEKAAWDSLPADIRKDAEKAGKAAKKARRAYTFSTLPGGSSQLMAMRTAFQLAAARSAQGH